MVNQILEKVKGLYGDPNGFSEERRRAFYSIQKAPETIKEELKSINTDINAKFYILQYGEGTVLSLDI